MKDVILEEYIGYRTQSVFLNFLPDIFPISTSKILRKGGRTLSSPLDTPLQYQRKYIALDHLLAVKQAVIFQFTLFI